MKKILKIIFLSFLLGGCSQIKWAYRFSDWLIQSRLESFFDLQGEQVKRLESSLKDYKNWHRKQMLPKYSKFLRKVKKNLGVRPWDVEKVREVRKEVEKLGEETAVPWVKVSLEIYLSLSPDQIVHYKKKVKERDQKRFEKIKKSTTEKLSFERMEKTLDFLDIVLKKKQELIFKKHFKEHPFSYAKSSERRAKWGEKTMSCLSDFSSKEKKAFCLKEHFLGWEKRRSPESKAYRLKMDELFTNVINSFDEKQVGLLQDKLAEWSSDFTDLSLLPPDE
ncbi:DUF6279 family lipoprotein [Bacteriovoracales bacterium]|nr:DUF6279 family lipoprotein [Bacteriovoracales bacterium]